MFVQTKNPCFSRAIADALVGAFSVRPAAALLVTPFVHLFKTGPGTISKDFVKADFTEAAFTGYAAVALTLPLLGPINADATHDGVHMEVDFLAGAVTPPGETILGYWIDNNATTPTAYYMAEIFATPIPIASLGDYISLDTIWPIPWSQVLNP
jgi:hypothetical protein